MISDSFQALFLGCISQYLLTSCQSGQWRRLGPIPPRFSGLTYGCTADCTFCASPALATQDNGLCISTDVAQCATLLDREHPLPELVTFRRWVPMIDDRHTMLFHRGPVCIITLHIAVSGCNGWLPSHTVEQRLLWVVGLAGMQETWRYSLCIAFASAYMCHMEVSWNRGTTESSMLMGCSIIYHPFWGVHILGNPQMCLYQPYINHLSNILSIDYP